MPGTTDPPAGTEHGDRDAFLAPLRRRLRAVPPTPAPDPIPAPRPQRRDLDLACFVEAATAAGAEVEVVADDEVPAALLDRWVRAHDVRRAVGSDAPEAVATGRALAGRGVTVDPSTPEAAAAADMGITSASALVASTGSLVVRSDDDGRLASLLPPVHLCVAPADRLVATPGAVLRELGQAGVTAGFVLVTGTSRTGDIEQLLTRQVHGPGTVLIVVTGADPPVGDARVTSP